VIERTEEMVAAAWDEIDFVNHTWESVEAAVTKVLELVERDYHVFRRPTAEQIAALPKPKRRLRECVEAWPAAETGGYDPRCCRWPKSCSASVYDPERVADEDLEPER
jgi:hypothetical protein